jgi:2'-5' RNA ligase
VATELTALRRREPGINFVRPENWHITLRFLGNANAGVVMDALSDTRFDSARAHLGAIDIIADRALVVRVDGLDALAGLVTQRTSTIGEPPRETFIGHLTLAYLQRDAPKPQTLGSLVTAEFDVEQIALVLSRVGSPTARYDTIRTWSVGR